MAEPKEVDLTEDDPGAMQDLCLLVHLKRPAAIVGNQADAASMLRLAVTSDKYGCADAQRPLARVSARVASKARHASFGGHDEDHNCCAATSPSGHLLYLHKAHGNELRGPLLHQLSERRPRVAGRISAS